MTNPMNDCILLDFSTLWPGHQLSFWSTTWTGPTKDEHFMVASLNHEGNVLGHARWTPEDALGFARRIGRPACPLLMSFFRDQTLIGTGGITRANLSGPSVLELQLDGKPDSLRLAISADLVASLRMRFTRFALASAGLREAGQP